MNKIIKVEYAKEKETCDMLNIISYQKLEKWPMFCRTLKDLSTSIEPLSNDRQKRIPLDEVTDEVLEDLEKNSTHIIKASTYGTILEISETAFVIFEDLFSANNAYLFDRFSDIKKLGLGAFSA